MPHLAALKLCDVCDQVSLVRTTSREVRCTQRFADRVCRSRQVETLSVVQFNLLRAQEKVAWEGRIGDLEVVRDLQQVTLANVQARLEKLEERSVAFETEVRSLGRQNINLEGEVRTLRTRLRDVR